MLCLCYYQANFVETNIWMIFPFLSEPMLKNFNQDMILTILDKGD